MALCRVFQQHFQNDSNEAAMSSLLPDNFWEYPEFERQARRINDFFVSLFQSLDSRTTKLGKKVVFGFMKSNNVHTVERVLHMYLDASIKLWMSL